MKLVTWLNTLTSAARALAGRTRAKRSRRQPTRHRLCLEALEDRVVPSTLDSLYVGDVANNTVQRFDASTGAGQSTFVQNSKSLAGPMGMLFDGHGDLLVANQNLNRGKSGEILQYDAATGAFKGELVPFQDPNSPFAPRGMVLKDNVLYVASLQSGSTSHGVTPSGEIDEYNATTGAFLARLTPPATMINGLADQHFNPRGIVFGPDGNLYVASFDTANPNAGYVMELNQTDHPGAWSIVAYNNGDSVADPGETADLHRPEGLVFGPDGRLYVTSFRASTTDTDKIVIFNAGGTEVDKIDLDVGGQARSFGQALLFGPGGSLYMPITGNGPETGAVRSYNVATKTFTDIVAPGSMGQPFYLTFGNTDPATLAYHDASTASISAALTPSLGATTAGTASSSPQSISSAASVSSSSTSSVAAPTGSATPTTGTASTSATDPLFIAWADALLASELAS
jgi:sugar lactone lactonase YvrE